MSLSSLSEQQSLQGCPPLDQPVWPREPQCPYRGHAGPMLHPQVTEQETET